MFLHCPSEVQNATNDHVEYMVVEKDQQQDMGSRVCYSNIMSSLESGSFQLRPHNQDDACSPNDLYLAWMQLCRDNGLIPDKVEFFIEDGKNSLKVPGGIYDKHWVYATLCCFRFADSYQRLIWLVVENMKHSSGVFTFWQALHYAMAMEYTYGPGHSFSYIAKSSYDGYGIGGRNDLCSSLAIALFFRQSVEERKQLSGCTNENIKKLADKLGGSRRELTTVPGYSKPVPKDVPIFKIGFMADLLTARWTPMYQLDSPTKDHLQLLYEEANRDVGSKIA